MKKRCLMFLIALALSLSTLLLCGSAMAEWYIVNVENYSDVQRYCESFILTVGGNTVYNSGENGVDSDINPSANARSASYRVPDAAWSPSDTNTRSLALSRRRAVRCIRAIPGKSPRTFPCLWPMWT